VQQMAMIFSSAQNVIAWMGSRSDYADLFRYIRDDLQPGGFFDADYFLAFDAFRQDRYWRRAWITQEVHLADTSSSSRFTKQWIWNS
jgi:erythromycin esterase-like protein